MDQGEVAVFAELGDVSLYDMVFTNSTDIAVSMNGLSLRAFRCVFLNGSSSAIAALGACVPRQQSKRYFDHLNVTHMALQGPR